MRSDNGQSVLEVLLASAIFLLFSASAVTIVIQGMRANRLGLEQTQATLYASAGLEAVRSIKNQSFDSLVNSSGVGLTRINDNWSLSGSANNFEKFTRILSVSDVFRDANGNIVSTGGSLDPLTKKVTSTTSWTFSPGRSNSVSLTTYLSDWRRRMVQSRGLLVYSDGGTNSDLIKYQSFDGNNWGIASTLADIDPLSTNKVLRAVRLYSSPNRSEIIAVSRHYNGSIQSIYAQVFNGDSWGNLTLVSSWSANTFLDVQNFDGAYLANGDFMFLFSDNTNTPKYKIWNGSVWSSAYSAPSLNGIPVYLIASVKPDTNQLMMAAFDQNKRTTTSYFDGSSYTASSWSTPVIHATNSPVNTKKIIDFTWSPNNSSIGALVYADSANDKNINIKIWTSNSTSGAWSSSTNSPNLSSNVGPLSITGRSGVNQFIVCAKDAKATPTISCFNSNFSAVWSSPKGTNISNTTHNGIQRSYHLASENASGDPALIVFSDNSNIPKYKKYNGVNDSWDSSPISLSTTPYSLNTVTTIRLIPQPQTDDIMLLVSDVNLDLYSQVWDGSTDSFYGTPPAKAFLNQSTNGSVNTDYWYDFVWD